MKLTDIKQALQTVQLNTASPDVLWECRRTLSDALPHSIASVMDRVMQLPEVPRA